MSIPQRINLNLIKDQVIRENFSVIDNRIEPLPIGTILEFGNVSLPEKFLLCDGRGVSRSTYASLFAVLGIKHGIGDGSTTFNLPTKSMTTTLYGVKYK